MNRVLKLINNSKSSLTRVFQQIMISLNDFKKRTVLMISVFFHKIIICSLQIHLIVLLTFLIIWEHVNTIPFVEFITTPDPHILPFLIYTTADLRASMKKEIQIIYNTD